MTKNGTPILTDDEIRIQEKARETLIAAADLAKTEKYGGICFGEKAYQFLVGQGAKVVTKVDCGCSGKPSANDTATLEIGGYRLIASRYFREPTREEFAKAIEEKMAGLK